MPLDPPIVPACKACWEVCFAHLYPRDKYLELAPPPPPPPLINPRSAPVVVSLVSPREACLVIEGGAKPACNQGRLLVSNPVGILSVL